MDTNNGALAVKLILIHPKHLNTLLHGFRIIMIKRMVGSLTQFATRYSLFPAGFL